MRLPIARRHRFESLQVHALAESAVRLAAPRPEIERESDVESAPRRGHARHVLETRLRLPVPGALVRADLKRRAVSIELIEDRASASALAFSLRQRGFEPRVRVIDVVDGSCELQLEVESQVPRRWIRPWAWIQRRRAHRMARELERSVAGSRA